MRKLAAVKFVNYVNNNIGRSLTTGGIASKAEVHVRRVQAFCKGIRGSRKVGCKQNGRAFVYTFRKPLKVTDLV